MANVQSQAAVLDEIRLIVVEAQREGDSVQPETIAKAVAGSYADSGLGEVEIAEGIRQACIEAGVRLAPILQRPTLKS
jgi:hypothetical protein